jgi:phosphatidylethanolamine/phosphatidyl-N-methylethanolamine N-methyltransferase
VTTNETLLFLKEGLVRSKETGSICPTSQHAASALIHPLKPPRQLLPKKNARILEVGAGTGSVTRSILKNMISDDTLTVCELNHRFMTSLMTMLTENEDYQKHKPRVSFFGDAIQALTEERSFDLIISALPFLNFDIGTIKDIFQKFKNLSNENTVLTYYEYIGVRRIGKKLAPKKHRERLTIFDEFFTAHIDPALITYQKVWLNVLPIYIYTLRPYALPL